MKFNQKLGKNPWAHLIIAALVIGLTACDSDSGAEETALVRELPTGAATGILMDTPVAGVSYAASSGKTGVTNDKGIFNFDHGDKIEFKLGSLILGNIQATPLVTPIALADGHDNKLHNLLVLLQSLDSDGNPSNGISITADAAAAVNTSIDLKNNPDTFAASPKLKNILEAADVNGAVKTVEEANAHFLSQGVTLLSTHIWASYDDQIASIIRVAPDGSGEYLQGQASPDDSCDENRICGGRTIIQAGVEYGTLSASEFDTRGFKLTGAPTIDTNLKAGLSHPNPTRRFLTDGYDLIISDIVTVQREREPSSVFGELFHIASPIELSDEDEPILKDVKETRYAELDNVPDGIVGAWAYDKNAINSQTLIFFANDKFMMVDPTGETQRAEQAECGEPGVEFASYTYNKSANELKISGFTYNTNGCAGFSDGDSNMPHKFTISADGKSAKLEKHDKESVMVYRISE